MNNLSSESINEIIGVAVGKIDQIYDYIKFNGKSSLIDLASQISETRGYTLILVEADDRLDYKPNDNLSRVEVWIA